MTDKRERFLLVLGLIFVCLIGAGISGYQMREYIPRINKQVANEPINGQLAYETIRGKACLVSGLDFQCTTPYSESDPDMPDLTPLPAHSSFVEIYKRTGLIEIDGEESILLTEAALAHHLYPRWSPDRQLLAYSSNDPDTPGLCLADADGDNEECYRVAVSRGVWNLSWSPDGRQIAFSAIQVAGTGSGRDLEGWAVYIFDLDTSTSTVFLTDAYEPSWSPEGQRIAFASYRDGNSEIYTIDLDGSNLRRITNDPADDNRPAWSPSGDRIAFLSDRGGDKVLFPDTDYPQKRIYIVDAEGGEAQLLLSWSKDSIERFVWGE